LRSGVVVAAPEADALREAAYFVDRLVTERMPLAGLVLNRTHPLYADLSHRPREAAAGQLEADGVAPLAAAVLRLHVDRVDTARREKRLLARFGKAHPLVPVITVPAMARNVHDLPGLREMGHRLAGGTG